MAGTKVVSSRLPEFGGRYDHAVKGYDATRGLFQIEIQGTSMNAGINSRTLRTWTIPGLTSTDSETHGMAGMQVDAPKGALPPGGTRSLGKWEVWGGRLEGEAGAAKVSLEEFPVKAKCFGGRTEGRAIKARASWRGKPVQLELDSLPDGCHSHFGVAEILETDKFIVVIIGYRRNSKGVNEDYRLGFARKP